jgi:hypothetical protein
MSKTFLFFPGADRGNAGNCFAKRTTPTIEKAVKEAEHISKFDAAKAEEKHMGEMCKGHHIN